MTKFLLIVISVIFFSLLGAKVEAYEPSFDTKGAVEIIKKVSPIELKAKMDKGEGLVIVDVRDKGSFAKLHIKGAISLPIGEIEKRLSSIPKDKEIYFY